MPRGGGKGGTLLRACSFKLRYTRENQLSLQNLCSRARETIWRLLQNDNTYNFCLRAETGKDTKRNATAKLRREATGLDCACIKKNVLTVLKNVCFCDDEILWLACELSSECKQSGNE